VPFCFVLLFPGIEARGFIFGPPIALAIGAKFVPLRKPRKLPGIFHLATVISCISCYECTDSPILCFIRQDFSSMRCWFLAMLFDSMLFFFFFFLFKETFIMLLSHYLLVRTDP
jgi:hypothetical protein